MNMAKQEGFKIFIDSEEKADLDQFQRDLGMSQRELATRLVRWYLQQPDSIRKGVLGLWPEGMEQDLSEMIIARLGSTRQPRMAAKVKKPLHGFPKKNPGSVGE